MERHLRKVCFSFIIAALFLGFARGVGVGITNFRIFEIPVLFLLLFMVVLPFAEAIEQRLKEPFDLKGEHWEGEEGQREKWTVFYRYFGIFSLYFVTHIAFFSLSNNQLLTKQNEDLLIYIMWSICGSLIVTWIYSRTVFAGETTENV